MMPPDRQFDQAEKNTMNKIFAAAFVPSARSLVRGLRFCAAAVALHGMLLWLSVAIKHFFSERIRPGWGSCFLGSGSSCLTFHQPFFLYSLELWVDECSWMVRMAEAAGHCPRLYDMGCRFSLAGSGGSTMVPQKITNFVQLHVRRQDSATDGGGE